MTTPWSSEAVGVSVRTTTPPRGSGIDEQLWNAEAAGLLRPDAPLVPVAPADPLHEAQEDVQDGVAWITRTMGPWVLGAIAVAQLLYLAAVGLPLAKLLLLSAFVGQALALRWYVVNPALAAMRNPGRRFVSRQVARGLWLVFGAWGYTMGLVPLGGLVSVALAWFGLTWAIGRYLTWNLEREVAGLPVHRAERIGLTVLAVGGVLALLVLLAVAAAMGALISALVSVIGGWL